MPASRTDAVERGCECKRCHVRGVRPESERCADVLSLPAYAPPQWLPLQRTLSTDDRRPHFQASERCRGRRARSVRSRFRAAHKRPDSSTLTNVSARHLRRPVSGSNSNRRQTRPVLALAGFGCACEKYAVRRAVCAQCVAGRPPACAAVAGARSTRRVSVQGPSNSAY
jgi:hypothetical protein